MGRGQLFVLWLWLLGRGGRAVTVGRSALLLAVIGFLGYSCFGALAGTCSTSHCSGFVATRGLLYVRTVIRFTKLASLQSVRGCARTRTTRLGPLNVPQLTRSAISSTLGEVGSGIFRKLCCRLLRSLGGQLSGRGQVGGPLTVVSDSAFRMKLGHFP